MEQFMKVMCVAVLLPTLLVAAMYYFIRWRSRKITFNTAPSYNDNYEQLMGRLQRKGQLTRDEQIGISLSHVRRHGFTVDQPRLDELTERYQQQQRQQGDTLLEDIAEGVATAAVVSAVSELFTSDSSTSDGPSLDSTPDTTSDFSGGGGSSGGGGASGEW